MTTYTDEVNIYNPEAVGEGIDGAAQTATNYVTEVSNDGIWVTPSNAKPTNGAATSSTTGWHISDVLEYFRKGASYIKLWVTGTIARLRLGLETSSHLILDNNSVEVFTDASTSVADFGATTRIGKANAAHMSQDGTSSTFYDADGVTERIKISSDPVYSDTMLQMPHSELDLRGRVEENDEALGTYYKYAWLRQNATDTNGLAGSTASLTLDSYYQNDSDVITRAWVDTNADSGGSYVAIGAQNIGGTGFPSSDMTLDWNAFNLALVDDEYGAGVNAELTRTEGSIRFRNDSLVEFAQNASVKVMHGTGANEIWLHSNSAGRAGVYSANAQTWLVYVDENGERHYPGLAVARTTASGTAKNSAAVSAGSNVNVTVNVTAPTTYTYYSAGIVQISRSGTNASGMVLLGVTMNSATSVTVSYKNTGSATVAANAMTVTVGLVFLGLKSVDAS